MYYTSDKWVFIRVTFEGHEPELKVFASWRGGYLDGDSWKLSSGTTAIVDMQNGCFEVQQASGSVYRVSKDNYGTTSYSFGVLNELISNNPTVQFELLSEDEAMKELQNA